MHCIKDILEIAYYIAFIVLTWKIVQYARRTYELESSREYELLCKLNIVEDSTGDSVFWYALEIYNAGNKVAKKVEVQSCGKHITSIDFVKPGSSAFFPLGMIISTMGENYAAPNSEVQVEKGKLLKMSLIVDEKKLDFDLNTDILFSKCDNVTGTLKGIEEQLVGIKKAIDTEYQRKKNGF